MRALNLIAFSLAVVLTPSTVLLAADAESLPEGEAAHQGIANQCLDDLQAFDNELEEVGFGILPPGGYGVSAPSGYYVWGVRGTPRQKIGSLRDAAYFYALDGDEQSCQMIFASMRKVYEQHQSVVGSEADDPSIRTAWRRAHLSRAKPIRQMSHLMRTNVLIGSEIRNLLDQKLGTIKDIVLNPETQSVLYVLVSRGGFLGFGKDLVAVPWRDLRATEDHEIYVLDASIEALENAPKVGRLDFDKTADADWQASLSSYWDAALKP